MDRISGGELFERVINDDFILTEKACIMFMRQICEGIAFMHCREVLHLDLKVFTLPFSLKYVVYILKSSRFLAAKHGKLCSRYILLLVYV